MRHQTRIEESSVSFAVYNLAFVGAVILPLLWLGIDSDVGTFIIWSLAFIVGAATTLIAYTYTKFASTRGWISASAASYSNSMSITKPTTMTVTTVSDSTN